MIDVSILPNNIVICDGSCLKNPGPGGWAIAVIRNNDVMYQSGNAQYTTNNIMEMTAAIMGLKQDPSILYTDSSYVVNGFKSWIQNWKKNGWKTSHKQDVKNVDLWKEIDSLRNKTEMIWIRGHSDPDAESDQILQALIRIQNEVDLIARNAARNSDLT